MNFPCPDYEQFLSKLEEKMNQTSIDTAKLFLDHICYRVDSLSLYEEKKRELAEIADLLVESEVGGRPIAVYKLLQPIIWRGRTISVIELPAPKVNNHHKTGREHAEFVVDEDLLDFIKKYPHITFNTSGIDKVRNADVEIEFEDCAVKFHRQSLEEVINSELKNTKK